ncbi:unnamed protein product [Gemmata massiliana]|uniref:Uncharacterized protein n=1 Tax=Gemmata massiliana TaxID=1210884 RepID=A0A6P2D352_9BACT|nr:hypothetical protein [Gemmata massiliana]VTR94845.1 unnamed protein product [Gemmata massiliana]
MPYVWILCLTVGTLIFSFVGAIILQASLHAANAVIQGGRRRATVIRFPTFDWSVSLMVVAHILNHVVNWSATQFVRDQAFIDPTDEANVAFASGLISLPFNLLIFALVLQAGLKTTFLRAGLLTLFQVVFSVVYAVIGAVIAVTFVFVAWAIDTDGTPKTAADLLQSSVVIGGIIAGVVGAGAVFTTFVSGLSETGPDPTNDPRTRAHPRTRSTNLAPAREQDVSWTLSELGQKGCLFSKSLHVMIALGVMIAILLAMKP